MKIDVANGPAGVFISGGLDSSLLYHLILKENKDVVPLMVFKNNVQYYCARRVITYLQDLHGACVEPILLHNKDIRAAFKEAIDRGFRTMYVGVIKELDEFLINWEPNNFKDTEWVKGPFKDLDKKQIVQLTIEQGVEDLFLITRSCVEPHQERCNVCNRCRERRWGFEQLGLTDPGVL